MSLRVVAGSARGRRLETPPGNDVRPTSDRVREAVFNALGSQDALRDAVVLDLFAGSGALGIEALSRGAGRAVFVDAARRALDAVRANVAAAGMEARSQVVQSDALDFLAAATARFDLVLADPPYAFDRWPDLWGRLGAVAPGAVVVAESDRAIAAPVGAAVLRERRYGGTVVTIISLAGAHPPESQEPEDLT
jgi:16S rRNA (guanine966-N2)-methyltransferase